MELDKKWFEDNYSKTNNSLADLAKLTGLTYSKVRGLLHASGVAPKAKYRGLTVGQHKRGITPWNKGLTKETDPRQKLAAIKSAETRIKNGSHVGDKHYNWKGGEVKYKPLHKWVKYWKGKPGFCLECGATKNVDWANISGEYHRDLNDFKSLCRSCHMKFDNARRKEIV